MEGDDDDDVQVGRNVELNDEQERPADGVESVLMCESLASARTKSAI